MIKLRKMASKTIMIQEDTYEKLKKLKRGNESFNDLILRLVNIKQNFNPFFGILSEKEGDAIDGTLSQVRISMDRADKLRGDDF